MLQQTQIDEIISFCETKGVKYYDLQVELVDHIADSIENLQKINPALNFTEALQLAAQQFGSDEFEAIVISKKKLIERKMSRLIEKEFLSFFTIPKIMITIFLLGISLIVPYYIKGNYWIWFLLFIVYAYTNYHIYPYYKEIRAIKNICRVPLLSIEVQSRYEKLLRLVYFILNVPFLLNLFIQENIFVILGSQFPKSQKFFQLQLFFVAGVFLFILLLSSLYVKRRVYNTLFDQYTKAFLEA